MVGGDFGCECVDEVVYCGVGVDVEDLVGWDMGEGCVVDELFELILVYDCDFCGLLGWVFVYFNWLLLVIL